MKEAIFNITNTSYKQWYNKHYTQDTIKLILTGTATIEQIEEMTADFNVYTYKEIELRNFNILDSTYDNGSPKTYASLYYKANKELVLEHKYNGINPRNEIIEIPPCIKQQISP